MYRFSVYPIHNSIGSLSIITINGFRFCSSTKRVHRSKHDLIFIDTNVYLGILTLNGQNFNAKKANTL